MTTGGSRRFASVWLMLLLPPVSLAVLIFAYVAARGLSPDEPGMDMVVRAALPALIALNHGALLVLLIWILRRGGERLRDIGWSTAVGAHASGREILVGLACGVGLYLLKELAADPVRQVLAGDAPTFTSLFRFRPTELDLAMAAVATGFVFVEESIYRGFALPRLAERHGTMVAVFVTSIAFGLLHWGNGPEAIAFTSAWGVLLAAVFLWRRNLVAVTAAHALYNLMVLLT